MKHTISLTLAGSLISAGLKDAIALMIENDMVDAVVSTGANIVDQDFFEAQGFRHYKGTPFIDDQMLRDIFSDPDALGRAYAQDPESFKELIRSDAAARDVIALQRRRDVVETMRSWLTDSAAFDAESREAGGPERAWQKLLEANPWVLGVGLGGQLLTSWDDEKLEQVTSGSSIGTAGKRTDALLRTNGFVRSMVFAEIKHHRTDLLAGTSYRSACWGPSAELTGAVVQVQQTVRMAVRDLGGQSVLEEGQSVLVPSRALTEVIRSLGDAEEVTLVLGAQDATFRIGGVRVTTRLISGDFPNYRGLIPETQANTLTVDRHALIEAVRRVKLMARESTPIRLEMSHNSLELVAAVSYTHLTLPTSDLV